MVGTVDRWADPKVDRTEGRWVDPRVGLMADRWAVRKVDRREDRSVGPRVDRTGDLKADLKEDRWGAGSVALTGRTEATSPEWMEQQAASMPVPQQALGLQASRVQEAGRRRAPVPRPQAMSALPAA